MDGVDVRPFTANDRAAVIDLWRRCELTRPWNDPGSDIDRKVATDPQGFLVLTSSDGDGESVIVASVMAGYDGHRGWINYMAVDPDHQRRGHAATIMRAAETLLTGRGCPKINLQIRTTNLDAVRFYESIGYSMDEVVSMGRRLIDDDGRDTTPPA
jgi:ribosomal protein S18 acetylase RimI-like enzyme